MAINNSLFINNIGFIFEKASRFAISFILAKAYGPENFGAYSLAFAIFFIVETVTLFSLQNSSIKFYWENKKEGRILVFFKTSTYTLFFSIIIILFYVIIGKDIICFIFSENTKNMLNGFIACLIFYNLSQISSTYFKSNFEFIYDSLFRYFIPSLGLLIGAFFLLLTGKSIFIFPWIWFIVYFISFSSSVFCLYKKHVLDFSCLRNLRIFFFADKKLIIYSSVITLITLLSIIISEINKFVIGYFLSEKDVGIFTLDLFIATLPNFIISSLNQLLPSFLSKRKTDIEGFIKPLFVVYTDFLLILSLPALCILFLFSDKIIFYFGKEYLESNGLLILYILYISPIVNVITGPSGVYLQFLDKEKIDLKISIIIGLAGLILSIIFVYFLKLTGAALSYVIMISSINLTRFYFLKKSFGISFNLNSIFLFIILILLFLFSTKMNIINTTRNILILIFLSIYLFWSYHFLTDVRTQFICKEIEKCIYE